MSSRTTGKPPAAPKQGAKAKIAAQRRAQALRRRRNRMFTGAGIVAVAVAVLAGLYAAYGDGQAGSGSAAGDLTPREDYQVGKPGPGQQAPGFTLTSSTGGKVSLSGFRGKTVLLYFQEGVGCQPCFDQITDLEKQAATINAAGIDQVLSITTSPQNVVDQKVRDMGLKTPVLSDPDVAVSKAYEANKYRMSMMGPNFDGHSFLLIGPDGTIKWRADYGGAPKETMYVPVNRLLNDIKAGNR
jgi:peroxiredoxin